CVHGHRGSRVDRCPYPTIVRASADTLPGHVSTPCYGPAVADGDARYRLLYEESVRALEDQQTALDELRSRTGVLLSAASISTSFLGGLALRAGTLETPGWVAIGAFVATAIFVCLILI